MKTCYSVSVRAPLQSRDFSLLSPPIFFECHAKDHKSAKFSDLPESSSVSSNSICCQRMQGFVVPMHGSVGTANHIWSSLDGQ